MTALAPTLQAFFTERLIRQRHASGHTVAAYRDTPRLLLVFASTQTAKKVSRLAIQTGRRAAELTALTRGDLHLGVGAHVACHGKGRKDRITPLTADTVSVLRAWLAERGGHHSDPLFPTNRGGPMSHDALHQRLALHAAVAAVACPSLAGKNV